MVTNEEITQRNADIDAGVNWFAEGGLDKLCAYAKSGIEFQRKLLKELEKENDLWDKQLLVEMLTQLKTQAERINELETENDDIKRELSATKDVVKLSESNLNRAYERRKMLQYELAEQRAQIDGWRAMLENSNKWTKRWKKAAQYERNWGLATEEELLVKLDRLYTHLEANINEIGEQQSNIAALENAAKRCTTCERYQRLSLFCIELPNECEHCSDIKKFGNWVFNEKKFNRKDDSQ